MIKYECDKGITSLEMEGDVAELYADIATLIHIAFRQLFKENSFAAIVLRESIESSVSDMFKLSEEEVQDNE